LTLLKTSSSGIFPHETAGRWKQRIVHSYSYSLVSKYRNMVDEFDKVVRDETPKIIEENGD